MFSKRLFIQTAALALLGFVICLSFAMNISAQQSGLVPYTAWSAATDAGGNTMSPSQAAANSDLPVFPYTVTSTRDGNTYSGVMVGQSPFGADFSTTTVNAVIVPVILTTNSIAVKITNGHIVNTKPGTMVFDPTAPVPVAVQNTCSLSANNVPLTLFLQSPIFTPPPSPFLFGTTMVGDTQYVDAFQRGNFWKFVGGTTYHTILRPEVAQPVSVNLPAGQGYAIGAPCSPLAIVDYDVMFRQIFNQLLKTEGVNSSQFPIFLFSNTVMAANADQQLGRCCTLGFHAAVTQQPGDRLQTYAFIDFETSGAFGPTVGDTSIAAHEVGEWMDDPFGNNPTPAWGGTGQVAACQANLEVGDPLTGTDVPVVTGSNGFKYHLQELAFFSWFYGSPSIAVNGWFSDNNTFKTDAGPVCMSK